MGITERKQREKERRIREILEAAKKLFIAKGYEETTMLDIADEAELSRRTLYHYFTSKEAISYTIIEESYEALKDTINQASDISYANGYRKLEAIQSAFLTFYQIHFDLFAFTLNLDLKLNYMESPTEDAQKCLMIFNTIITDIEKVIEAGITDGSIREIAPPRMLAVTAVTMIQSTLQKLYIRKGWIRSSMNVEDEDIIRTMFSLFLTAIGAET